MYCKALTRRCVLRNSLATRHTDVINSERAGMRLSTSRKAALASSSVALVSPKL